MEITTITINNMPVKLRTLSSSDVRRPRRFLVYINTVIADPEAMLLYNRSQTYAEEQAWLRQAFAAYCSKKLVMIVAEHEKTITGTAHAALREGRSEHVAELGIALIESFRGFGLGRQLMQAIIEAAQKDLVPGPESIRLSVFEPNQTARKLYQGLGFLEVARIPEQYLYRGRYVDEIVMQLRL